MFFVFGSESKVLLLDWAMLERMVDVVSRVPRILRKDIATRSGRRTADVWRDVR